MAPSASSPSTAPTLRWLAPSGIKIGDTTRIAARLSNGDPVSHLTWNSDNPAICVVSSDGIATGLRAGTVTISAMDGQRTGSTELNVVPDASGDWNGQSQIMGQRSITGVTRLIDCSFSQCLPFSYQVHVDQVNDQVTVVDSRRFIDGAAIATTIPLTMQATINTSGAFTATGGFDWPPSVGGRLDSQWTASIAGGTLFGQHVDTDSFTNFFGPVIVETTFQFKLNR